MKDKNRRYPLTWLTSQLAVGHAPMSYDELDSIREQGVVAIVNLCGEFTDLHEIEEQAGFEVYFLPTPDECAPELDAMEDALSWLDEALYLKKKVLVHCRHGHGRTGTFISAYLLRRGLALKFTEKKLKGTRANPTNYSQWKLLKQYSKQQGQLKARDASIENPSTFNLQPFLKDYEALLSEAGETDFDTRICRQPFDLQLIESVYISHIVNSRLSREKRNAVLERALRPSEGEDFICPLAESNDCLICVNRPLHCRTHLKDEQRSSLELIAAKISKDIFLALTESFPSGPPLHFSINDTVSGRFVQQYFQVISREIPSMIK